jgi:hypothetical protein
VETLLILNLTYACFHIFKWKNNREMQSRVSLPFDGSFALLVDWVASAANATARQVALPCRGLLGFLRSDSEWSQATTFECPDRSNFGSVFRFKG